LVSRGLPDFVSALEEGMQQDNSRPVNYPGLTQILTVVVALAISIGSAQAGTISTISSTVPANGDVNPYGIAQVPTSIGSLVAGNLLISNFNNSANLQGTGTTLVQITPTRSFSLFAHGTGCIAHRLGNRGQPAHHRRNLRHRASRMPDRVG
jgi:hypothetical protein